MVNTQTTQENHDKKKSIVCKTKTCENISFTVPVEVRAHADVRDIDLKCKGFYVIKDEGKHSKVSKFEIVQEVSAQIPIDFVTEVEVRDEFVDFDPRECNIG
ncbi:MAG: hypothetical protein FWB88_00950 [Defluviitaleaceae bacterium]|nr:hypothetical protein [Defluviitaleaceae bacterium]MCL2238364.1 hypothetical protein [Defluviitaleaceae bacterium]